MRVRGLHDGKFSISDPRSGAVKVPAGNRAQVLTITSSRGSHSPDCIGVSCSTVGAEFLTASAAMPVHR